MLYPYIALVIILSISSVIGVPLDQDKEVSELPEILNFDNHDLLSKVTGTSKTERQTRKSSVKNAQRSKKKKGQTRDSLRDRMTAGSEPDPNMRDEAMNKNVFGIGSSVMAGSESNIQFSDLNMAMNQTSEMTDEEFFTLVVDAFLRVVSGRLKTVKSFSLQMNPDIEKIFLFLDKDSQISSRVFSSAFANKKRSNDPKENSQMRSRFTFKGLANIAREGNIEVINRAKLERKTINLDFRIGPVNVESAENMILSLVNFTVSGNMEIRLKTAPEKTTLYMSDLILRNPTDEEIVDFPALLRVLPISPTALVLSAVEGLQFEGLLKKIIDHTLQQPAIFNIFTAIPEFLQ